jgi:acetoin utilization deacetylase AcuC-like enzyme
VTDIALLTDDAMDAHGAAGHPEAPARRAAAMAGVEAAAAEMATTLLRPAVAPAGNPELELVHDRAYLRLLAATAARGGRWLDPDTYLVPGSWEAARLAAGATLQAARAVSDPGVRVAFAAVRPPGHHADAARGAGFCLLNNVAVAAAALRAAGVARVAIVDWDVHHGDGTQAIFDADPSVLYASTHQSPLYPGTGDRSERGTAEGKGTTCNRPLSPGSGDEEFVAAWLDLLGIIEGFRPEAVLVSAGYDAHRDDPLAQLRVSEDGYRRVARELGGVVGRLGLPGVALALEGGYDPGAMERSVAATLQGLMAGLNQVATLPRHGDVDG